MAPSTDRIEKRTLLRAPQSRVWRAVSESDQFGTWFRMAFDAPFAEGQTIRGRILHPGHEHIVGTFEIVRIEPERYFAWRWHPYAIDPDVDYSTEPTTLVEFFLEPSGEHTVLTMVESGFDRLPTHRRDEAYRMNESGWAEQLRNVAQHVAVE